MSARGPIFFNIRLPSDPEDRDRVLAAVTEHLRYSGFNVDIQAVDGEYRLRPLMLALDLDDAPSVTLSGRWLVTSAWLDIEDNERNVMPLLRVLNENGCVYVVLLDDGEVHRWRGAPELGAREDTMVLGESRLLPSTVQAWLDEPQADEYTAEQALSRLRQRLREHTGQAWEDLISRHHEEEQQSMSQQQIEDLVAEARHLGAEEQDLDDLVADVFDGQRADVNNAGLERQIAFLVEHGADDALASLLARLRQEGR